MSAMPTPQEIEADATAAGLSIPEMCRKAGVAPSTFYRWRDGSNSPAVKIVDKWLAVVRPTDPAAIAAIQE